MHIHGGGANALSAPNLPLHHTSSGTPFMHESESTTIATGERRQSIRFPAQVETVQLCFCATAHVIDESWGGIGVVVDAKTKVRVGQQLSIEYNGAAMPAIVRKIDERIDGSSFVGLEWKSFPAD